MNARADVVSTMQDDVPLTVPMILRHALTLHGPARIAVVTPQGTQHTTVAATAARIHALTGALRAAGVQPGECVGTFAWNTLPHLEAYFAIPASGGTLHTINVRLALDDVAFIVGEARDRLVFLDASLWETFVAVLPQCPSVEHIILCGDTQGIDTSTAPIHVTEYESFLAAAEPLIADVADERAPAAMCYTSGTTGRPKGVVYSHRSIYLHAAANLFAGGFGICDRDTVLQVVPMFHANGWGFPYAAFLAGASLVLPDRHLAPEALVSLIQTERPTVSGGVPTVWRSVFDHAEATGADVSSLRLISCAGSVVPQSLLRDWLGRGVEMYQAWGMTETSPLAAIARPPHLDRQRDQWYWRTRTGRAVPGVEIRAVGDDGVVLPADGVTAGDLQVRGPWVAGRYHGDRGSDAFQEGWLRTGDVGTIDDAGAMKITDRSKDLIKSGGEWISSAAIEDRLCELPDVVEAACIGIPDPRWQERPLALVTVRPGATVTMAQVREHLEHTVAPWQVPDRVLAVSSIARTGVGKIDKPALRHAYANEQLNGVELPSG